MSQESAALVPTGAQLFAAICAEIDAALAPHVEGTLALDWHHPLLLDQSQRMSVAIGLRDGALHLFCGDPPRSGEICLVVPDSFPVDFAVRLRVRADDVRFTWIDIISLIERDVELATARSEIRRLGEHVRMRDIEDEHARARHELERPQRLTAAGLADGHHVELTWTTTNDPRWIHDTVSRWCGGVKEQSVVATEPGFFIGEALSGVTVNYQIERHYQGVFLPFLSVPVSVNGGRLR